MIALSELKELLHYDLDTGVFAWRVAASNSVRAGSIAGNVNTKGYVAIGIKRKLYKAHRLAWFYVYGDLPPDQLDHINRIKTDNRICNLRLATNSENQQNKSMHRNNTSGHVGVVWNKQRQKWQARIKLNNKYTNIGLFTDISEAVAARAEAKAKYHKFQPEVVA